MQYWLMKSEPDVWSIEQQIKAGLKGCTMGWSKKLSSS
jgi:predicted RNA-binding protein with PUA-like domain